MAQLTLQEQYATRPVRFLELWQMGDWRLKLYGITYDERSAGRPRPELLLAGRETVAECLRAVPRDVNHYGVGFAGVHEGRGAAFVFVDFWVDENELHHHVFVAPAGDPLRLRDQTATGLAACAWDLALICFERQSWVEAVLANPDGPDLARYLATRLNQNV